MFRTLRSVFRFRRLELDPIRRRLAGVANVADLRSIARSRLPRGVFDYIDGAAEDEITLARNEAAFRDLEFRPRILRNVGAVETGATLLGKPLDMPLVLAPTGFTRIADPEGELAVARSAHRHGIPYTLSTLSTRSIEEVAAVHPGRKWFQVYVWRDRGLVEEMLQRARDCDYEAIVITVDTAVLGRRERDVRSGFSLPPKLGLGTLIDGARHPSWTWNFVRSEPIAFANLSGRSVMDGSDPISLSEYVNRQFDSALSWKDIDWFRERWDGPILLKGVQSVADAKLAAETGIDAIALSNHGGRLLDGAPTADRVDAAGSPTRSGGRIEILCDGGIRRGSDIAKALALGATACMAGRAYLYGLGAAGESGVDWVLSDLRAGLERTMALLGTTRIEDLRSDLVRDRSATGVR